MNNYCPWHYFGSYYLSDWILSTVTSSTRVEHNTNTHTTLWSAVASMKNFKRHKSCHCVPSCITLCRGTMSTRPGRDHFGKSSCLTGGICFQLLCICMALAGHPLQPYCSYGGVRCICIESVVVKDSLAELDLFPPPCLFGMLGICKAVSICWLFVEIGRPFD